MHYRFLLVLGLGLASVDTSGQEVFKTAPAVSGESDASAFAVIFNEQHIVDSGHSICLRAAQRPPAARFKALRWWVVPDPSASRFRVTVDFVAGKMNSGEAAQLFSPAYELIRLAGELGQIDRLRSIVLACPPGTPTDQLDRFTLLALIAIEADDETALDDVLDQWFKRIQSDPALLQYSTTGLILLAQSALEMIATVQLELQAETNEQDIARIQTVRDRQSNRKIQCLRSLTVGRNVRRSYFAPEPADGTSGRLMICRRAETIYCLAADNDSNGFRLVGKETFPTADLQPQGIRLGVQAQGPEGLASVRFTELTVRAERLAGAATRNHKQHLAELNQQRDKLPLGFSHDFSKQPTTTNDFLNWSSDQNWDATDRGLELVSVGTDNWTATGLLVNREFAGDFDITFQFSPTQLPTPKQGQRTQVYLQLELTDADRT